MPRRKTFPTAPKFLRGTVYGSLELVTIVEALNRPQHPGHDDAKAIVDSLITWGLRRRTVGEFNRRFGRKTVPLRLKWWGREYGGPLAFPDVPVGKLGYALWHLLISPGSTRLKRCPECTSLDFHGEQFT